MCAPFSALFFLSRVRAGRSVASIRPTVLSHNGAMAKTCCTRWSLIKRKPPTPTRLLNWCSIRTSGTDRSLRKCAKRRNARCSPKERCTALKLRPPLSTLNRCVRQSCAARKHNRGPGWCVAIGQRELIKSSGTNSVNISSKATEPTAGRDLNTRTGYRKIPNMSRRNWKPGFFCRTSFATIVCNLIRNTLRRDF